MPYSRPRRRSRWRRLIAHESLGARPRVERVARVRAADVRADRAARRRAGRARGSSRSRSPRRGRVVGVGRERERRAARPAADHLRGEPEPRLRVARAVGAPRRTVEEAPEAGHVLLAAGGRRGSCRCARGRRGRSPPRRAAASAGLAAVEQRPARVQAVLVRVAEDELAGANGRLRRARLREPLDERLRDPVAEAERLEVVEVRRAEPVAQREPARPRAARVCSASSRRQAGGVARVEEEREVDPRAARACPTPTAPARSRRGRRGCALRCAVVIPATNSFENIAQRRVRQPEPREAGAREREVERTRRRAAPRSS